MTQPLLSDDDLQAAFSRGWILARTDNLTKDEARAAQQREGLRAVEARVIELLSEQAEAMPKALTDDQVRAALYVLDTTPYPRNPIETMRRALAAAHVRPMPDAAGISAILGDPVAWRDPTNTNPGQGCTYKRAVHEKWPHIYTQALYALPQEGK
jgi:hypothetical protein